ncbi:MAG: spore coat protein CotJB [Firmicutes bacterium]|nr:spore coat protein CotJB [Candidatus Fermentithermobacillaceae bacterium]
MDPEQRAMLMDIMQMEFTAVDLQLFLDTHPDDQRALSDFRATSQALVQAKMSYESRYGPLLSYGFGMSPNAWRWVDEPWPWEINWKRS